ncbi:MAG: tetratricopeptide repeat protein, partial [Bacteroidota bacterium]
PNVSKDESLKKAVEYYQRLYQQFPKDERAPKALFMSGFILANELRNIDAARLTYQQFLDKFPKHELTTPARTELDNLGKTPEEILQEKTAKK